MGTKKLSDAQAGFSGGLFQIGGPAASVGLTMSPASASALRNIRILLSGDVQKREGTQRSQTTANVLGAAIQTAFYWGSQNLMVATCGGAGSYTASGTAGIIGAVWGPLLITASTGVVSGASYAEFTDATAAKILYVADTLGAGLAKCTSAGVATYLSACPAVTGITTYNNRLWGWKSGTSNALYYSDLNTTVGGIGGDSLGIAASGGGQINVTTFDAAEIITCAVVGSSLLIFHTHGISRLTGFGQDDTDVAPQGVSDDISILGSTAITVYEGIAYIATRQGVVKVTEGSVELLTRPDAPDPTAHYLSFVQSEGAVWLGYNPKKLELYVLVDANNDDTSGTFVYNVKSGIWYGPWTGPWRTSRGFVYYPGSRTTYARGPQVLLLGGASSPGYFLVTDPGYYKDDLTSAASGGTAYTASIQLHRFFANDRQYSKAWRWITLMAALGDTTTPPVVTAVSKNGGTSTTTLAVTATAQDVYYVRPGGTGPYLDVTITDAGVSLSQYASIGVEGFLLGER